MIPIHDKLGQEQATICHSGTTEVKLLGSSFEL